MTMTTASLMARAHDGAVDEPDPAARPRRRSFTAEYKARILDEYDALPAGSEGRGALLRREGLYTSHIAEWRKVRDAGAIEGLTAKGRKAKRSPEQVELDKVRRRAERLEAELARTKLALEITGKARALGAALRERGLRPEVEAVIEPAFAELVEATSAKRACELLGKPRATHYRRRCTATSAPPAPRPTPPNALSEAERQEILAVLRSEEYCDLAPAQVMGPPARRRHLPVLHLDHVPAVGRRRREPRAAPPAHPSGQEEARADRPAAEPGLVVGYHQTPGPTRGVYYECFVIIDIYSRYVVGWMVTPAETGELAEAFIADTLNRHGIKADQLTLHADRGTSMTSKPVAQLLVDLGVARSHSRPHVSNDNPYSEANFKTLKYCPAFPGRFGSIEDARTFCANFFDHYNHIHRHAGVGLHTPASLHYGTATEIRQQRTITLDAAYAANPSRFRHRRPTPPKLPTIAWINEPTPEALIKSA